MPVIEHIEIASGNVPPFAPAADLTDTTRIFVIAKSVDKSEFYVLKYSLPALLDFSRSLAAKTDVIFDVIRVTTDTRYVFNEQKAGSGALQTFQAASGYTMTALKNK